ncbi:WD40-repeat-containing domain protein [Phakopsora pachyrhizi]|uniref:Pre-mRNA-processing factor 19 n=1 Tax=Phakopsora pachyrhizi TaxID=170000 RepID=A0AAV0B0Y5_PHAPC|nr:WD40-repeat-containing domain protein [Phakopsora pachyrhizi]KAI8449730.1 WD40-repeat-containing domain protein [Phakopsora pachyrhizi]CAH7674885.1 WD40-repeat-containing domain protein [Phakopsora pachyrhizi]CAH7675092.1 WD40-repeat-containing domain protein [Phakopsora pachyrhizi]
MFCAISGISPLQPVISIKSGHVYERKLIEKYLKENDGKDPITGDILSISDLVDVKTVPSAPAPPPRTPSLSSVPALLHILQNEWDASMLECYELRKQNSSLRQELSHALYKEDASMRVLARVIRERDEAREALSSVRSSIGINTSDPLPNPTNDGDSEMKDGSKELGPQIIERIDATSKSLTVTRKKRKVPEGYASPADLKTFIQQSSIPSLHSTKPPGITCLQVTGLKDNLIVTGGMDKVVQIYDRESEKVVATMKGLTKKVNSLAVVGGQEATVENLPRMIIASADKVIRFWKPSEKKSGYVSAGTITLAKEVSGIDLHPSQTLLLSGHQDGTWAIHDLEDPSGSPTTVLTVIATTGLPEDTSISSIKWHPDGVILAVGLSNSTLKVFDVKNASCLADFEGHRESGGGPINCLSFSENGYSLATISTQSTAIKLWDLRKLSNYHSIDLPDDYKPRQVKWDYSAQFIGVIGNDLRVWQNKTWEQLIVYDDNSAELTGLEFIKKGKEVVIGGMDRKVAILSSPTLPTPSMDEK